MVTDVKIYSEKDLKRMIKKELSNKFYAYDIILNSLKLRLIDIEQIMMREKRKR